MYSIFNSSSTFTVIDPGIHIPDLLKNYPMKLHEIKTMCTNISPEHMSNFRCTIII